MFRSRMRPPTPKESSERRAARALPVNARSSAHQLYRLLARLSGLVPPVDCDQPWIQRRLMRNGDERLLCLFNHAWQELSTSIDTPGGEVLYGEQPPLAPGRQSFTLGPKEAVIFRLLP